MYSIIIFYRCILLLRKPQKLINNSYSYRIVVRYRNEIKSTVTNFWSVLNQSEIIFYKWIVSEKANSNVTSCRQIYIYISLLLFDLAVYWKTMIRKVFLMNIDYMFYLTPKKDPSSRAFITNWHLLKCKNSLYSNWWRHLLQISKRYYLTFLFVSYITTRLRLRIRDKM